MSMLRKLRRVFARKRETRIVPTEFLNAPPCPVCLLAASSIERPAIITRKVGGDTYYEGNTAGERYGCVNGHYWTGGGRLAGPPEDIEIREGWFG